jgi:ribosome-associated protein
VSQWVVVDFGSVICHVFLEARRGFYDLEGLWNDAPRMALEL